MKPPSHLLSPALAVVLVLFILMLLVLAPLITIWSLNTLFALGIAYGVAQWLAVLWLSLLLGVGTGLRMRSTS